MSCGCLMSRLNCICHDLKSTLHRLDELGICHGGFSFDTALAAYDLNPSQSDYPVSKLATNFLGTTVDDGDAAACAEALWHLRPVLEEELEKEKKHQIVHSEWNLKFECDFYKSQYESLLAKILERAV